MSKRFLLFSSEGTVRGKGEPVICSVSTAGAGYELGLYSKTASRLNSFWEVRPPFIRH